MAAILERPIEETYSGDTALSPKLRLVRNIPSLEEVLQYEVKIDFSDASNRADQLSALVEEARTFLSLNPETDTEQIEHDIEAILLDDSRWLNEFANLFVDELMPENQAKPGSCGLAGMRYNNPYPGDMGLLLFKTRIKKGKNTLAKAFRKSTIDQNTAEDIINDYAQHPDEDNRRPYLLDPESQTIKYNMDDISATRAILETEKGIEQMRAWIYLHPELEVLAEEDKDKPTYKAHHLQVRYKGIVREVQLMTAEAEQISLLDDYHNDAKNDVASHARR